MRIVRIILIVVFLLSLGLFGTTEAIAFGSRDTTLPEITSDRDVLEIPCDYTEEQLLEGLTAYDEADGDLTSRIIPGSLSRFIDEGVCNVTYVVFDSSNNPATLTRQVHFTDYHPPRFTLTEPLVFAEQQGSYTEAMSRLGAEDLLDGDLSEWITQTDTTVSYQRAGVYTMTVQVSSSMGDTSTAALPVHVVSAESLAVRIMLSTGLVYVQTGEEVDPYRYVRAAEDSQGEHMGTSRVVADDSEVNTDEPGIYEIHYEVTDSSGNRGETWLTVIVEE